MNILHRQYREEKQGTMDSLQVYQRWIKMMHSINTMAKTQHTNTNSTKQVTQEENMSILWQKQNTQKGHKKYKVKSFVFVVALKKAG